MAEVFEDRFVKPLVAASERELIENPCEREIKVEPKQLTGDMQIARVETAPAVAPASPSNLPAAKVEVVGADDNAAVILETVHELTGFDQSTLNMEMRVLDDLNMDSIKASELVSTIAMKVNRPGK